MVTDKIKAAMDIYDRLVEKKEIAEEEKNFVRFIEAIYKLGHEQGPGLEFVTHQQLLDAGFSQLQIINALDMSEEHLRETRPLGATDDAWLLNNRGVRYAEMLKVENEERKDTD